MPEVINNLELNSSSSDTSSVKCTFVMTPEQKDWLLASLTCDEHKLTGLLGKNPDLVHWKNCFDGNTALHYAAKFGDAAIIRLLVGNYSADVNARNNAGLTPLHLAAEHARTDAIILLTSNYGANTCLRDYSGKLPSAYLPSSKEESLKRFFKDPVSVLISNRKNFLFLLVENSSSPHEFDRQRSLSNSPARIPRNFPIDIGGSDSDEMQPHLPINTRFPWQTSGPNQDQSPVRRSRDNSLSRLGRHLRGRGSEGHSRETSQERTATTKKKKALDQVASIASLNIRGSVRRPMDLTLLPSPHTGRTPKRYTAKYGLGTRRVTAAGTNLADDIYASIRRKRELTGPIYNPLCPKQRNKEGEASPVSTRAAGRRRGVLSAYDGFAAKTPPYQRDVKETDDDESSRASTPVNKSAPDYS